LSATSRRRRSEASEAEVQDMGRRAWRGEARRGLSLTEETETSTSI
jgi:hypothetical protein